MLTDFGNIAPSLKALFGFWYLLLFWGYGLIFVLSFFDKRQISRVLKSILLGVTSIILYSCFQCVTCSINPNVHKEWVITIIDFFNSKPIIADLIIATFFTISGIIIVIYLYKWNKSHITSYSIKEAINTLPSGIAYYEPDGRITLKNETIDNLAIEITGKRLLNGLSFEEFLKDSQNIEAERINDITIVKTKNKGTWSFEINELSIKGEKYKLLLASDISEEYKLTDMLKKKEKDLLVLNNNLVEYNKNLITIISEKERLNAKIKIHDELGLSLIEAKQYILNNADNANVDKLKAKIEQGIDFLREETKPDVIDEYELMINTANDLGVKMILDGELPKEKENKHIVSNAMHETLTNVLKYSDANEIIIKTIINETKYHIYFTTNVFDESKQINPTGGLKSLKELVEKADGIFEISQEPNGILNITLNQE